MTSGASPGFEEFSEVGVDPDSGALMVGLNRSDFDRFEERLLGIKERIGF